MNDEGEIEYEREGNGTTFYIKSVKSSRRFYSPKVRKRNRLFFIGLKNGDEQIEFPFSIDDQLAMLKSVLDNIVKDAEFERRLREFAKTLKECRDSR